MMTIKLTQSNFFKNLMVAVALLTTINASAQCLLPPKPSTITATGGNTKVCPGDAKIYSIAVVSGATSYLWTPPTGGIHR